MLKQKKPASELGRMRKELGVIKKQLKETQSVIEDQVGCEHGVEGQLCLDRFDISSLRKDLSKISDIVRRFGDELEITPMKEIVQDWNEIDSVLKRNSDFLEEVENGMDARPGRIKKIREFNHKPDVNDEEENGGEENAEDDLAEDEDVAVAVLGGHRQIKRRNEKVK